MMTIKILAITALLALSACTTTFEGNKVDYKSQGKAGPGLEVPPDLTQLTKNTQAFVPAGGAANASAYGNTSQTVPAVASVVAANTLGGVRVERLGAQRWLVVGQAPDKLWDEVKAFWLASGFTLVVDQPTIGIMETEWNENRAKIPQDWFGRTVSKVLGNVFSTNERDKYRTRMERTASGSTEIYITHRGMLEDFIDASKTQLQWKPRPADPELEIEFLKRLMVRLGAPPEAAKTALDKPVVATAVDTRTKVVTDGTQASLLVSDPMDQAWRRVGLSLDRTNFTVEDRDRSKGIYFVRYAPPDAEKNAPGFFARMFGAKAIEGLQKYQIVLTADVSSTRVQVATAEGQVLTTADAKNILKVLSDDLK